MGENDSTVVPEASVRVAVGVPLVPSASLTLFTPAVIGKVPEAEPIDKWSVYEPIEKTTAYRLSLV